MNAARTPRARPGQTSPMRLTAQVEPINTVAPAPETAPPVEPSSTPARQRASTPEDDGPSWVNFSTYLPADLRRELKARCAQLDVELRQATADAIRAWLSDNPAR
jgi:hypothetical protein